MDETNNNNNNNKRARNFHVPESERHDVRQWSRSSMDSGRVAPKADLKQLSEIVFRRYEDPDDRGHIDAQHFKLLCYDMGYNLTPEEIELGIKSLDSEGDGKLRYEDFLKWWRDSADRGKKLSLDPQKVEDRMAASQIFQAFSDSEHPNLIRNDQHVAMLHGFLVSRGIVHNVSLRDFHGTLTRDQKNDENIYFRPFVEWIEERNIHLGQEAKLQGLPQKAERAAAAPGPATSPATVPPVPSKKEQKRIAKEFPVYPEGLLTSSVWNPVSGRDKAVHGSDKKLKKLVKHFERDLEKLYQKQWDERRKQYADHARQMAITRHDNDVKLKQDIKAYKRSRKESHHKVTKAGGGVDDDYVDFVRRLEDERVRHIAEVAMLQARSVHALYMQQLADRESVDIAGHREVYAEWKGAFDHHFSHEFKSFAKEAHEATKLEMKHRKTIIKAEHKHKKDAGLSKDAELAKAEVEVEKKEDTELREHHREHDQQREFMSKEFDENIEKLKLYYSSVLKNLQQAKPELDTEKLELSAFFALYDPPFLP